jgi:hypothetical protein
MRKATTKRNVRNMKVNTFLKRLPKAKITAGFDAEGVDDDPQWGYIWNTLEVPGLRITYSSHYSHPPGAPSNVELDDTVGDTWTIEMQTMAIVDESGNLLNAYRIGEILEENTNIKALDLTLLGEDEIIEIADDIGESSNDVAEYELGNDEGPGVRFRGELIAEVKGGPDTHSEWCEASLYRSLSGKYVCHEITCWWDKPKHFVVVVCDDTDEVIEAVAHWCMGTALLAEAQIDVE